MAEPRIASVIAAIDASNESDPRRVETPDGPTTFERLYSKRMTERLMAAYPNASELLRIAARAQHLRRWEIKRGDYPEGRLGYNEWRKAARVHHAQLCAQMMLEAGYDEAAAAHVGALIRKEQLKKDPESQALENVAAMVFVEHYFDEFLEKYSGYDTEKIVDILGKTLCKMSPKGHAAALALPLPERTRALVAAAIQKEAAALGRLAAVAVD